jgi:hypothetical protein
MKSRQLYMLIMNLFICFIIQLNSFVEMNIALIISRTLIHCSVESVSDAQMTKMLTGIMHNRMH